MATTGSPNYVTGHHKVTSVSWTPSKDPTSCCKDLASPPGSLSEWMCQALCVLCCMELQTEIEYSGLARDRYGDAVPADSRDFPTVSPNNGELSFTTSQYGKFIPIVFGSDKLDGNVFWASPINEQIVGDVAAGDAVFYRTINFAFGLCEGTINGLLRLWMGDRVIWDRTAKVDGAGIVQPNSDGFLLGATVDLTEEDSPLRNLSSVDRTTKISVFAGSETQLPEGVMVTEEGYENVPAYRGLAYILFENFVLGSGGSVPALFAEVTSNTQSLYPRLYGNLKTPVEKFDQFYRGLFLDPTHNHFIIPSRLAPGGVTQGIAVFDNTTLVESSPQQELETRHALILGTPDYERSQVLKSSFIAIPETVGNNGNLHIVNPFTGDLLDSLGPGGGLSGHSVSTGFSGLQDSAHFVAPAHLGVPGDVFVGLGTINRSIGFAYIDNDGQITMKSTLNLVIPHAAGRMVYSIIDDDFRVAGAPAKFAFDSKLAKGVHVYVVSNLSGETVEFHVSRVTCDNLAAPVYTEIGQIPVSAIGGDGIGHDLLYMFMDPIDNCLVLCIAVNSVNRNDRIIKWSPFTGAVLWSIAVPTDFRAGSRQAGPNCFLREQKYAWFDGVTGIHEIDLKTGLVTTLATSLAAQSLPAPNTAYQFYNGWEDAITYYSGDLNKALVKVYLNRITRSTVELGDIVSLLLARVGLLPSDILKTDLQALTLNGYTVNQQQSLRACFAELGQAFKYDLIESNGRIKYKTRGEAISVVVPKRRLGEVSDDGWLEIEKQNDISRIRKINLTYRDIDREYADNVQSFILPKYGTQTFDNDAAIDVSVPIVLEANKAKTLAEILLYSKLVYNTNLKGKLPGYYANLDPADVVTLQLDDAGTQTMDVRLRRTNKGNDQVIEFEASEEDRDIYIDQVNLFGSIGRFEKGEIPPLDARIDPMLVQIPYIDAADAVETAAYKSFLALLPFKSSATIPDSVTLIFNGTQRIAVDPPLNFPTWGFVTEAPLRTRAHFSKDDKSTMRVRIMNSTGAVLQSVPFYIDMLNNSRVNLAYVGGELIQFQNVVDETGGYYLLTGLHRGKFGTEMFCETQSIGARFILLAGTDGFPDTSIVSSDVVPLGDSPRKAAQVFFKTNNPFQPVPVQLWTGLNLRPWAVADLRSSYSANDAVFTWQRRTRYDGEWIDDGLTVPNTERVPLNETEERYQIYLFKNPPTFWPSDPTTYLRRVEVTTPNFTYTQAMQVADGFDNTLTTLYVMVNQIVGTDQARQGAARQRSLGPKV